MSECQETLYFRIVYSELVKLTFAWSHPIRIMPSAYPRDDSGTQ